MIHERFTLSKKNPAIGNHLVQGQALLPGLAYIDIVYQVFRKHSYAFNEFELRNLCIYRPLVAGEDAGILTDIYCTPTDEGLWHIRVEGQQEHNDSEREKTLYATAEMRRMNAAAFEETLDQGQTRQAALKVVSLDEVYEQCRAQGLVHTGFMKAEGTVYVGESSSVIEISITEDARVRGANLLFHPAIIDGSGIGSRVLFEFRSEEEESLYLPLFFRSFRAFAPLSDTCMTRIQTASLRRKNELLYQSMEFFNASGNKVAELTDLAGKLVRDPRAFNHDRQAASSLVQSPAASPRPAAPDTSAHEANAAEGSAPFEIVDFLRTLLADVLEKPKDAIKGDMGYYEMGLDSSRLLEIVKRIESKIGAALTPTLLFEYATIAELAAYLWANHLLPSETSAPVGGPNGERFSSYGGGQSASLRESASEGMTGDRISPVGISALSREKAVWEKETDIAVIGMAGRYPQASNLREFWTNLKAGKDCISDIPPSRWDCNRFRGVKSPSGKDMSRWGGFIEGPEYFDAQFFRISPREAETIDPQERLFLQVCWEAIEDAGYTPQTLTVPKGRNKRNHVGVFVGVMHKDYAMLQAEAAAQGRTLLVSQNVAPIANRVSYFCNFHGPSLAVDTVCSSSLTAVHLALESIRHSESEVALAGGVNLSLHPNKYMTYGLLDMYSSDGYCHSFGKGGDGYVSAEGVGAVVLKPLRRAVHDRDHIYAVIKGSSINHGGKVSGFTVPSPVAQADMIADCMEKAGVHPRTISYVEAHGTGTSLGDPIEIQGLIKAYRQYTPDSGFCSIGSVKSNIGHAESAAGISGLQKTILQLYYKTLVPSLHSEEMNPHIDFRQSPFFVQHKTEEWKQPVIGENRGRTTYPRRAGVSAFGATGSNAHIILEEYPHDEVEKQGRITVPAKRTPAIIPLSARNKDQLQRSARNLLEYLRFYQSGNGSGSREGTNSAALQTELEARIGKIISAIVHVDEYAIEPDQELAEYGMEPIQIRDLEEKIKGEFKVDVGGLAQKNSVSDLAARLIAEHGRTLEGLSDASPVVTSERREESADLVSDKNPDLSEIAYTLQTGREAMGERTAFLVNDISDLVEKLELFGEDNEQIPRCWRGHVPDSAESASFNADPDAAEMVGKWIAKGKLEKIAEIWAKGFAVDWQLLYSDRPQRVSLPTYPFARERYWVAVADVADSTARTGRFPEQDSRRREKKWLQVLSDEPPERRRDLLEAFLKAEIASILNGTSIEKLDLQQPLAYAGFDSWMALQLKNVVELQLDVDLSNIKLFGGESIADITTLLLPPLTEKEVNASLS